jgi:hypothetical protein
LKGHESLTLAGTDVEKACPAVSDSQEISVVWFQKVDKKSNSDPVKTTVAHTAQTSERFLRGDLTD